MVKQIGSLYGVDIDIVENGFNSGTWRLRSRCGVGHKTIRQEDGRSAAWRCEFVRMQLKCDGSVGNI